MQSKIKVLHGKYCHERGKIYFNHGNSILKYIHRPTCGLIYQRTYSRFSPFPHGGGKSPKFLLILLNINKFKDFNLKSFYSVCMDALLCQERKLF